MWEILEGLALLFLIGASVALYQRYQERREEEIAARLAKMHDVPGMALGEMDARIAQSAREADGFRRMTHHR